MDEDHVDILADLGREHPGRPGLGGGDLDARGQRGADAADIGVELVGRDIAAQLGLVAHDHPVDDAAVGQRRPDAQFEFLLVLRSRSASIQMPSDTVMP